jgi:hypothetical protein
MLCIEVTRNGRRVATGGVSGRGGVMLVFGTDQDGVRVRSEFVLAGCDATTEPASALQWARAPAKIGDRFLVRFVERREADPARRLRSTRRASRRARLKHLRELERQVEKLRTDLEVRDRERRRTRSDPRFRKTSRTER